MNPCDTCALGKCGGAADEANNRVKAMICAYGANVFWCHHGKDGTEYDWKNNPLGPMTLAPQNRKVCSGWQRYVKKLKQRGFFDEPDFLLIRKMIARKALRLLERTLSKETPKPERDLVQIELEKCVRFIVTKDIGPLEIPL